MKRIDPVWTFKLLGIFTGRTMTKQVSGFTNYEDAAACAKSLVPAINGPAIVLSYM
jgi:hypothetical protein